ncbi:MAG: hypothetical protein WCK32_09910 [Chlorobiaceae bacterium]
MPSDPKKTLSAGSLVEDTQTIAKLQRENKRISAELTKAKTALATATVKLKELITESKRNKELLLLAAKKENEQAATIISLRTELDHVIKREQNAQINALAQITQLQKTLKELQGEKESMRAACEKLDLRLKETDGALVEYRKSDDLFIAALGALRPTLPALANIEQKPVPVIKVLFETILDARQQLEKMSSLEKQLIEEQAKNEATDKLNNQIGRLVEENRLLHEQLEMVSADSNSFAAKAKEANASITSAVEAAVAKTVAEAQQTKLILDDKVSRLETENKSLMEQMKSNNKIAFVSPERVSTLLDDFYGNLRTRLKGLDLQDSEIRLKVGFASLSDTVSGFVIPTAGNTAEIKDSLGEVVLRLGKNES